MSYDMTTTSLNIYVYINAIYVNNSIVRLGPWERDLKTGIFWFLLSERNTYNIYYIYIYK
jgi:hypothetical protein